MYKHFVPRLFHIGYLPISEPVSNRFSSTSKAISDGFPDISEDDFYVTLSSVAAFDGEKD